MDAKILNSKSVQYFLTALILSSAFLVVFTPNFLLFKWGANYAVHIMFAYLGVGLLFLMFRQPRLMFTSFACCAGLCLYLKDASNTSIVYPNPTGNPVVDIAHFNISASNDDVESTIQTIMNTEADLISIQEMTPDWNMALKAGLQSEYPYSKTAFDPKSFIGLALYSKFPFSAVDTFNYDGKPSIIATTKQGENEVAFLATYIYPELSGSDYARTLKHFEKISERLNNINTPIITFGDWNQVQWSSFVKDLRQNNELADSRRFPFFDNPTDHIFYSNHFSCIGFKTVSNDYSSHLGIKGSYELNVNLVHAQRPNQKF